MSGQPALPLRVCFVCTGNICRSPTAEVVFRQLADEAGLAGRVLVDSAGTGPWHAGHDMEPRARHTLLAHGYQPHEHVAKQFLAHHFDERDVVLAIDSGHLSRLGNLARLSADPEQAASSLSLLRSHDPSAGAELDIPDPYYDDAEGFENVLELTERACAGLLAALEPQLRG
ncbi:MAG TPA: low molecular weight protein-tyrosine-phosphatase [Jatrophihabitans sp.]|nr:low molecular weight protein-tyrosine-phosphatase [Jatrophihabitans sp.]